MDRHVRAIVSHRLPNAEELEAGCGDWLECCQAYIHRDNCVTTKPQSTTEGLEPCPFCGAAPNLKQVPSKTQSANYWWIGCEIKGTPQKDLIGCGIGHSAWSKDEVIAKWNTRLSPASAAPVVDDEPHCWHCGVVLEATELKLRCDQCPADCDDELCSAFGCAPSIAAATAAPVEQSDDDWVVWLRYDFTNEETTGTTINVCDSDAEGAFKVYRAPVKGAR